MPSKATAVAPVKFAPVIVTALPTGPMAGIKLVIVGATKTVKLVALIVVPSALVTLIGPVVAFNGTVAVICVSISTLNVVAFVPLKATADVVVKSMPVITTIVPTGPLVGLKLVMVGATSALMRPHQLFKLALLLLAAA
jgi:hypothetical protein